MNFLKGIASFFIFLWIFISCNSVFAEEKTTNKHRIKVIQSCNALADENITVKVNEFLKNNPSIEIKDIEMRPSSSFSATCLYVLISYLTDK